MEQRQLNETDLYTKNVVVNNLSDLPIPVGGKITLLPNIKYTLGDSLVTSNYIVMANGTILESIDNKLISIEYSGIGACIRGVNVSCSLINLKIVNSEKGYDFSGTKSEIVKIIGCDFDSCIIVGTVDKLYFNEIFNCNFTNNTNGVIITDSSFVLIESTNWFGNNSGTYIDIPTGIFESIKIINNNLEINTGNTGIFIDETNITTLQKTALYTNQLVGTSINYIDKFNPLDGNIASLSNIGINNNEPPNKLTSVEMFVINNPRIGLVIFNTTINELVFWDGTFWKSFNNSVIFNEVLIDDFESGSFATKGWVTVNGGENDWYVGTADPLNATYSAYISNDLGVSNAYSSIGGALDVSHVYIDVLLPLATSSLVLQFDWKCEAEINYDYGQIHDVTIATTPVANTELGAIGLVGLTQYNNQISKATTQINLPLSEAGTTRRIVFSFRNDSSVENQPPFNIDNIKILFL